MLPNLARRPFVNRRPVQRTALLLWLVGGVLAAGNGLLYWGHISGAGRRHHELEEIASQMAAERQQLEAHRAALGAVDLAWQNDQVRLLNGKIAERTFSWSTLFDRLAEVLPRQVRLVRLQPRVAEGDATGRGGPSVYGESVELAMSGAAQSGEALYAFVDALFTHAAFGRPQLAGERHDEEVEFGLTVNYVPGSGETPAEAAASEETAKVAAAGEAPAAPEDGGEQVAAPADDGEGPAAAPDDGQQAAAAPPARRGR